MILLKVIRVKSSIYYQNDGQNEVNYIKKGLRRLGCDWLEGLL